MPAFSVERVYTVEPRGFCAGVERAIDVVEQALQVFGSPVYVRKEIVHNKFVVEDLKKKGAIFVEEVAEVPDGSVLIFSAHGISPMVREQAKQKQMKTIDATCPLVTKVHLEVFRFVKDGYRIVLIGHKGHDEVVGTMGESPENITLVGSVKEVEQLSFSPEQKLIYLTQTTLSVDETKEIVLALKQKFPQMIAPPSEDICYATQNRQDAIKELVKVAELVLVVGSKNSSNSIRLVEVARELGAKSYLIDGIQDIHEEWFDGIKSVGVSSGASAPELLVQGVLQYFRDKGVQHIGGMQVIKENMFFPLPRNLQKAVQVKNNNLGNRLHGLE